MVILLYLKVVYRVENIYLFMMKFICHPPRDGAVLSNLNNRTWNYKNIDITIVKLYLSSVSNLLQIDYEII